MGALVENKSPNVPMVEKISLLDPAVLFGLETPGL